MVAPHLAHSGSYTMESANPADLRLRIADRETPGSPRATTRVVEPLTEMLTLELDGAAGALGLAADELLLAALGRTIARTLGHGVVAVDVARNGRAVLHPVDLVCATDRQVSADDAVRAVHHALAAAPHRTIRHGILHYFGSAHPPSEVFFNDLGERAESPAAQPVTGHALELRTYRTVDGVQLEWWYDSSRFDRVTVLELTEQFPFALIELTSEATAAA